MGSNLGKSGIRTINKEVFYNNTNPLEGELSYMRVKVFSFQMTRNEFLKAAEYPEECIGEDEDGWAVQISHDYQWLSNELYKKLAHERDIGECSGDCFYHIHP